MRPPGRDDTDSEAHRHACEVRWLAARPTDAARAEYLAVVTARRGPAAADRLRRDVWALLKPRTPLMEMDGAATANGNGTSVAGPS